MSSKNRESMVKPEYLSEQDFRALKDATASLERIRGDAQADVERYLASPDGWASGTGSRSGLPTLLLTTVGRKSGEKRTTPLVFMHDGWNVVIVGSLAGYDSHPAWYLNLKANPKCWVQLDRTTMAAVGRDATEAERKVLWPRLTAMFPPWGYFQQQTDRPFGVVIISPTGLA